MASFEENGVVVSDDDSVNPTNPSESKKSTSSSTEQAKDISNNSSTAAGQQNGSKSGRNKGNKKSSGAGPSDQISRQEEILEKSKGKRYSYTSHTQNFLNAVMRPNIDARDIKSKVFKNQLMMSESMDEVPRGFAKNWLMVVCPLGSRCLVVASRGYTGAYTKTGYHIISHPSSLPMGNKMFQGYGPMMGNDPSRFGPCVLDCIYCNETETYYVIDIMCWNGQALHSCDTQTRFKIINERIREHDLSRPSPLNPYPFIPLKAFTPTKNNIHAAVTMAPYVIDGLIFYHKQLRYHAGPTPLMLWMTLNRLPSKMKIEIPEMGIFSSVSYKDPVSLALAHGVSPAIIQQVYPGSNNPRLGQTGRSGPPHNNHRGRPASAGAHARQYQQQQQGHPGFHYSQGYNQQGMGAMNDFSFLNEMMMNLNFQGGNYGMMPQGRSYQRGFNSNGNNSNGFYHPMEYRRLYPQQHKSKQQKKKNKQNRTRNAEPKVSNWDEPHSVMRSQWMESKPDDFEADFLTCICPMSKRRIIVAAKGSTCIYNKFGKLIDTYTSTLPNGSPSSQGKSDEMTILDCLWCGSFQKFFVIDVMHWRSEPFYDREAEYRFFWMSDKISGTKLKLGKREYGMEILPKYPSDQASLTDALSKADFKVDGLLSFQRKGKYSRKLAFTRDNSGREEDSSESAVPASSDTDDAPLTAVWLKLDMLSELLGYPAPPQVTFKASTEKERKQRAYFMGLNTGEKSGEDGDSQTSAAAQ